MSRRHAPFLVLETGRPVASMRRHGRFPHWIRTAAGLAPGEVTVVDVQAGATPPSHRGFAGILVTGSGAMVSDREDWSERSADWLGTAARAGTPVFGICYGHQLLAHALGGAVGDNPRGREMGTVAVDLHPQAADDPLFAGLPPTILAQATHLQSVLAPPDGATVLAASALDDCHAFRWGDAAWGVQFHPEFSGTHMRGYIHARRDALAGEGHDPVAVRDAVRAAPRARDVLRRFVRHARRGAAVGQAAVQ
ncbi:glutamine amidotransferase [Luteimonas sp. MC1782]|uniref:glutamine amidotransferase n=1 Tax=Luteimonas sp. MC1782 TaxID=2760305 RepID=UPI0015FF04F7|nr:glutamine amidotransferase [Luteimonas sp. MC1782]MBB1473335.1 glutamine amidotransferase [Luteimonas sp. MC1782]